MDSRQHGGGEPVGERDAHGAAADEKRKGSDARDPAVEPASMARSIMFQEN